MTAELEDWPRPHFTEPFGPALHFYVVYGVMDGELQISAGKYRCDGVPEGISLMQYGPDQHPEVVASFREGYLWEDLCEENPDLARLIFSQDHCTVLRGETEDGPTLNDFRNLIGLVSYFLDNGGVAVYDAQMFKWWTPEEWREEVFSHGQPRPSAHVTILVSEDEDETEWIHTRGMRKFGRPDISVHGVTPDYRETIAELFNRFIGFQALGAVIQDGQQVRMRGLPEGMECYNGGSYDDEDFNNVHVEILWPEAGSDVS